MFVNEILAHIWNGNPPDIWKQIDTFNKSASRKLSTTSEIGNRIIAVALQTVKSHINRAFKNSSNLFRRVVDVVFALFHNSLPPKKTHLLKRARNE